MLALIQSTENIGVTESHSFCLHGIYILEMVVVVVVVWCVCVWCVMLRGVKNNKI